jgi:ssDNA-binding replication factor A large subunit
MPLGEIIAKIVDKSGLTEPAVKSKIQEKMDELSGLISEQGAAHIVANELGVKLFESVSGKMKIKNILPGMRAVEAEGKVIAAYPPKEFKTESREGKVGNFILGDDTGTIRITLWNDMADNLNKLKPGDIVRIKSAYVRENQGRKELHLGDKGALQINPPGVVIEERRDERKKVADLREGEQAELLGTIVQVFNPTYYETCPQCRKRLRAESGFECPEHGAVKPEQNYVISTLFDDGSGSIRVAFFGQQAEKLIQGIENMKGKPELFEPAKSDLLGNIIKVAGNVRKDNLSGGLNFIARTVDSKPNPEEELKQ